MTLALSVPTARLRPVSHPASATPAQRQKGLGAFYTPLSMASVLTDWAVRTPTDVALDPSFGGLVFLRAARTRLEELGAPPQRISEQLYGIDLDDAAHRAAAAEDWLGLDRSHLLESDFFAVDPDELPAVQALIGNPPYIRYQAFNGSSAGARQLALKAGVRLSRLASSWAPFVVHGTSFLAEGGRTAQVLPGEILHAHYAEEVVEFLRREFGRIFIAVFEERIFPGALEDVVLLFAEGRGAAGKADIEIVSCADVDDLSERLREAEDDPPPSPSRVRSGFMGQLLPVETQRLYQELADSSLRFGEVASVDIGAVTGANEFFVVDAEHGEKLPKSMMKPAVAKAAQIGGARLTKKDHRDLLLGGQRALMLMADRKSPKLPASLRAHIKEGESRGFHERYKCRIRDPWWLLQPPKEGIAQLLLTYCSNDHPRLVVNEAGALNTNTIHGVRLRGTALEAAVLAAGFYNSLTLLSAELVGRSYGGGVLKLEPSEAEALVLPVLSPELVTVLPQVDAAIRSRDLDAAVDLVDPLVLTPLGLEESEILDLRAARRRLQIRRQNRGRPTSQRRDSL